MPYLLVFVISLLMVAACNRIELVRWRRSEGAHWAERARLYFPALAARGINLFLLPLTGCFLVWGLVPAANNGWHFIPAFLGAILGNYPFDRVNAPDLAVWQWAREACGALVLHAHGLLLFAIGVRFMPNHAGWRMAAVTAAYLLVHFALQFGLIRILRALHLLRPAPPRVHEIVAAASAALGVPVRGVWEMTYLGTNAFAVVTTGDVAFTSRLLAGFSDEEVRVIAAHELGHLSESRWTRAARLLGSLVFLPVIFLGPAGARWGLTGVAVAVVLSLLILALRTRLSRAMEKRADHVATQTETENAAYARALEHLHRANQIPAVLHKRATLTHPDLYDRMIASGLTPDFPRPAPPPRSWTSVPLYFVFFAAVIFYSLATTPPKKTDHGEETREEKTGEPGQR